MAEFSATWVNWDGEPVALPVLQHRFAARVQQRREPKPRQQRHRERPRDMRHWIGVSAPKRDSEGQADTDEHEHGDRCRCDVTQQLDPPERRVVLTV